jgi:hypothetical protein
MHYQWSLQVCVCVCLCIAQIAPNDFYAKELSILKAHLCLMVLDDVPFICHKAGPTCPSRTWGRCPVTGNLQPSSLHIHVTSPYCPVCNWTYLRKILKSTGASRSWVPPSYPFLCIYKSLLSPSHLLLTLQLTRAVSTHFHLAFSILISTLIFNYLLLHVILNGFSLPETLQINELLN